jgi:hypothetical protein
MIPSYQKSKTQPNQTPAKESEMNIQNSKLRDTSQLNSKEVSSYKPTLPSIDGTNRKVRVVNPSNNEESTENKKQNVTPYKPQLKQDSTGESPNKRHRKDV